jgi:hypothetical protein
VNKTQAELDAEIDEIRKDAARDAKIWSDYHERKQKEPLSKLSWFLLIFTIFAIGFACFWFSDIRFN